jgi:hypothetical protein
MKLRHFLAPALFLISAPLASVSAQNRPIGFWRAHLPYNIAMGVATDGSKLYSIVEKGFFTYDPSNDSYERYSKVEGLHETSTSAIAYDRLTSTCIIGYTNSNIDLFRNGNFKVMPQLKNKNFAGNKAINMIFARRGLAYISSGLGLVIIDLEREEFKDTYTFTKNGQVIGVNGFTADERYFYMITTAGLYRSSQANPTPQVLSTWQLLDSSRAYARIATVGENNVFTATRDSVFRLNGAAPQFVWRPDTATTITSMDGGVSSLYVGRFTNSGAGKLYHIGLNNAVTDSSNVAYPMGTVETLDGRLWAADRYQGLGIRNTGNPGVSFRVPSGPNSPSSFGIAVRNNDLWVAHGGFNSGYNQLLSRTGMAHFKDESWKIYQPFNFDLFRDSVVDIISVLTNPLDGTLYAGTYNSGLIELKADGSGRIYKQGALTQTNTSGAGGYPATSLAMDSKGYLWTTQIYTPYELAALSPTGQWTNLAVPAFSRANLRIGFGLTIDDYDQKWYYSAAGGAVIVYNDGGTPENPADDQQMQLTREVNGLPHNTVRSLMKDRDGSMWVGTDNGIGIFNSPSAIFSGQTPGAELRTVQYDQFAGKLFEGESVRAMVVDGGNRKWIGTTNGVWLLSPDALKIIEHFTVDNSPLPSNLIQTLAVDGITGDVYVGTDEGLVSYRGTSTDGSETVSTLQTFPNPVPPGYNGTIAIRGFVTDSDVRITDIAGQLIYRTKASGGQATWNGMDYTGNRPATGIYLVFATNKDGSKTTVGKFMFTH